MELLPHAEKRTLRYDFTAVEIHDLSLQLANKNKEVKSLIQKKKSVTSQCTAEINAAEAACGVLSNQVADGYEHREIECEVIFNQPTQGKKTIIRKDSNALVGIESMTAFDYDKINEENNLFNQNAGDQQVDQDLLIQDEGLSQQLVTEEGE